jgi:MFS family permease
VEYLATIRQINFARLWSAQILSQVAANLLNFALIILVYDLTVGSRFASFSVSLLVLSFAIPSIFAAPAAGTYVDFWDRKKVLVISNLLRGILVLMYIPAQNNLTAILALTFIIATITQFFLPAEAATIPKVVPQKYLLSANSLFVFTMYAAFLVGYSASGPAVAHFGKDGSYYLTAAMFLTAALAVVMIPPQEVLKKAKKLPKLHLINHIKDNWKIVTAHPDRFFALIQLAIIQGIVFILITLAPALSLELLKTPLQQASHVLIIPVGIGMVLGVLIIGTLTKRYTKRQIIEACLVLTGAALFALGLSTWFYSIAAGTEHHSTVIAANVGLITGTIMLMLGVMNALVSTAAQTMLQETTDDANRGKVFSSLQMLINIAATIPVVFTGLLADLLHVNTVIAIIGVALLGYGTYMLWRTAAYKRIA